MKTNILVAGALAVLVGSMALVGWAADITILKSLLPGWVSMKPNTALSFVLMGSALLSSRHRTPSAGPRRLPWVSFLSNSLALLAGLIGLLTLCEYAFGWNPGLDQWLFKEPFGTVGTSNPGRMAPDTALSFVLLAVARLAGSWRVMRRSQLVSVAGGSLVTTLAFVEIVSYFTPVLRTYGWGGLTMMALPTAVLFAVLGLAVVQASWREALSPRLAAFSNHLWWLAGSISVLVISFALYIRSEKQINQAHELRHRSLLFADTLRQSSDDLMRMARTYVVTGDTAYKQYFQDILDIQDGRKRWPGPHWRPELASAPEPAPPGSQEAIPLLELMRQARFTEGEFHLLVEAKEKSDTLTRLESEAIKLVDSTGQGAEADRARARMMVFDPRYLQARAAVMGPLRDFQEQVDRRTLTGVRAAENSAAIFRYLLMAFGLGLVFVLWRTYHALGNILGGPVDQVYSTITRIGGGDFSKVIEVKPGLANSVLGWLSETQARLNGSDQERQQAEAAMRASEQRFRTATTEAPFPLMIHAEDGDVLAISRAWTDLSGYEHRDIPTIAEWTSKAYGIQRQVVLDEIDTLYNLERRKAEGEYVITCKDGSQRVWDFSSISLGRMPDGRRIAMSMAADVTERKRGETEKLQSEAQYRTLFDTLIEGFCTIEVIFDDTGKPVDYRFLEVNPAFERQTGLQNAQGRLIRDFAPDHEAHWFEIYGKIALTGEPAQFENEAKALGRHFDVSAYRVGGPESRKVAILFNDISKRRETEAALRTSAERFRVAAETANDVVYEWDLQQDVQWHGKVDEMLGYEPGEFPRTLAGWAGSLHPDDMERTLAAIKAHLEERVPYRSDYRVRRKDGVYRWWSARGAAVRTLDGIPVRWIGSVTDFTEQKNAEDALRESESRFRQLSESLPQLVWTCLPEGPCDFLNRQWLDYTGVPEAQQLGFGWLEQIHPDDRAPTVAAWEAAVASGKDFHVDFRIRRYDGEYRWFDTQAVRLRDAEGRTVKWFGSNTDLTERKNAENEIRALNLDLERRVQERTAELASLSAYNRSLIEASLDPLVTIGTEGRIQDVNEASVKATGVPREALIGSDFSSYFTDPEKAKAGYEKVFEEGLVRDYPLAIRHQDGGITSVLYNATIFRDAEGRVGGVFAAARDVTESNKIERDLLDVLELNQKIIASSPIGIFACRADGPCVFANEAMARISGTFLETMLGLNYLDLTSWRKNGLREAVDRVLSTSVDEKATVHLVTTFGREISMKYQITKFTSKDTPHFLMLSEDVTEQKKAEEAIRAFGAYNRSLIEASLDPLVTIGADGHIQDVNEATIKATGVPRTELIGSDFSSYFTEPDKAKAGYEKAFEEGIVRDYELSIKHRDGGVMSVLYNASLYRDKDGQVGGIFAAARDITFKLLAERAMARNTAILDEAGRLARVGGWEMDLSTSELTWTESTYAIHEIGTDYKPTLEEGLRFYAPESLPIISRAVKAAIEDGTPFDEELEFITAKHNRIWVRAIGKGYREKGKITRVGGVFQDITAKKKSEALKTIQIDLAQLLGGNIDLMGAYSSFLDAAIEISGMDCGGIYAVDEATGCLDLVITRNLSEEFIRSSSHYERFTPNASLVLAGEPVYMTLPHPGGGEARKATPKALAVIPLLASGAVLGCLNVGSFTLATVPDDARETLELLASRVAAVIARIQSDLANVALNRELTVKTAQLEAANKELEAFSYSVSHDLRAPLRHMAGFVELLEKKELNGLDKKSRHYLKVVSDSAQKMGCLIDDLLSFSRMGRAEMMKQSVDLEQLTREVIEELSRDLPAERAIRWRIGTLPVVTGDRAMLRLAMANLLANSVKYSRHVATAVIEVDALMAPDKEWALSVRDNGGGFDMKYVDKLFGLFQRLHSTEEYEGTGVGLANVRRIIARHGGRTWAEGELNKGATFYFTLPME